MECRLGTDRMHADCIQCIMDARGSGKLETAHVDWIAKSIDRMQGLNRQNGCVGP